MEHDLTIHCTVSLPEGAVLANNRQTFILDGRDFALEALTFSSMVYTQIDNHNTEIPLLLNLPITNVEDTLFEEVTE